MPKYNDICFSTRFHDKNLAIQLHKGIKEDIISFLSLGVYLIFFHFLIRAYFLTNINNRLSTGGVEAINYSLKQSTISNK